MRRMILVRRAALALPLFAVAFPATSQAPAARTLLDVSGRVAAQGPAARFDLERLDALPQAAFATRTPWLDGVRRFSGVPGGALLHTVGASGREVVATALNDYRVTIPIEDFRSTGMIIATRLDGEVIPLRQKGPLWIIYPFDAEARLRTEVFYSRSIWQLRRLEFRD